MTSKNLARRLERLEADILPAAGGHRHRVQSALRPEAGQEDALVRAIAYSCYSSNWHLEFQLRFGF
jgi:hypothetical protein